LKLVLLDPIPPCAVLETGHNQFCFAGCIWIKKFQTESDNFILEIWNCGGLVKSHNLTDLEIHGPVYFDDELGCLTINNSGNKLAYIAEEKRPKSRPFFKASSGK
jgi:hypothetical protein